MTEDTTGAPHAAGSQWYDHEAGPLVRPYAMTGGRTGPGPGGVRFDLIAAAGFDTHPSSGREPAGDRHRRHDGRP